MVNCINYLAVVGPGTAIPGGKATSEAEIHDGLSNTLLIVEVANSNIIGPNPATSTPPR